MDNDINKVSGMVGTLRNNLSWDGIVREIKQSRDLIIPMLWMMAIGFVAGYLIKKYSKYLVVVVVCFGLIMLLQHFTLLSIVVHKKAVYELFGIPLSLVNQPFSTIVLDLAAAHKAVTLSGVVGFLLGVRIG